MASIYRDTYLNVSDKNSYNKINSAFLQGGPTQAVKALNKNLDLQVTSVGNPAMPMPVPMPVLLQAFPGMQGMMTAMMKKKMADKGVASLTELRELCLEADVKFIACQMTVDLFDMDHKEFIDNVEYAGAAAFFEFAGESDICLYI